METKLSVLQEHSANATQPLVEEHIPASTSGLLAPDSLFSMESGLQAGHTYPDTLVELFKEIDSLSSIPTFSASPAPTILTSSSANPISTAPQPSSILNFMCLIPEPQSRPNSCVSSSTSPLTASPISVSTPPSSGFVTAWSTPEPQTTTDSWFDFWNSGTNLEPIFNAPTQSFAIFDERKVVLPKTPAKKQYRDCQPLSMKATGTPRLFEQPSVQPKRRRKAQHPTHDIKQNLDLACICRIHGCRHISKTRFEGDKHCETHFPPRFQCPNIECAQLFTRSSSLARHFKGSRDCHPGYTQDPGSSLEKFALHPLPWKVPGFKFDDVSDML
ncbi:hypothetical protein H0H92_012926 [Tricholoma furcatifolium]|nr:hypothetical protein H0H92_012926 [Tricholoma furcatifolium]